MRRVIWSEEALDNLEEATSYVRAFSPAAAARLELRLVKVADGLAALADRGRPVSVGVRELTSVRPYMIRYAIVGDEVRILLVRHSARRPPP
jgi:toxin ParE1/3/4